MFVDLIVVGLLALALYKGFRKGFIVAIFSFIAFIVGLAAAIKLSAVAAAHIGGNVALSERWLPVISFVLVFILVVFLVRLGAKAIEGIVGLVALGWLNKLGGVLFFSLLYLFVFSIIIFYAEQVHLINPETAKASVSYSYLKPLGPKVIEGLGVVLPFFQNMFTELLVFFNRSGH